MIELLLRLLVLAPFAVAAWLFARLWLRCRRERDERPAKMSRRWAEGLAVVGLALAVLPGMVLPAVLAVEMAAVLGAAAWWGLGMRARQGGVDAVPVRRHDERDNVFVRNTLRPGTERFDAYYQRYPERLEKDNAFRALPGLFAPGSAYYQPYLYAAGRAMLDTIYRGIYNHIDGPVEPKGLRPHPEEVTRYLREVAKRMGVMSFAVTPLRDYHVFTHAGYGKLHGQEIETTHRWAIVFAVEMDRAITATAPKPSVWLEIGKHYLAAATVGSVLAGAIRELGFPARAHVLERDQVVMPLLARDAGLGEVGRIGVLMTPQAGPRVRLGVVTTELELAPDTRVPDFGLQEFCARCTKCADACPANAIPFGPPGDEDGVRRWQVNHEACFTFWNKTGVPCGRCLAVCPISGENAGIDALIKSAARGGAGLQGAALAAHDHLYGRKPRPLPVPEWAQVGEASGN